MITELRVDALSDSQMILTRRTALFGLGSLLAAPAVVRASSLMPVRAIDVGPIARSGDGIEYSIYSDHRLLEAIDKAMKKDALKFFDIATVLERLPKVSLAEEFTAVVHPGWRKILPELFAT